MLEPQDHPNDFQYPGGPPRPPYDVTGYTLAFQMGVQMDRILDPFDGPFEKLPLKPLVKLRRQQRHIVGSPLQLDATSERNSATDFHHAPAPVSLLRRWDHVRQFVRLFRNPHHG